MNIINLSLRIWGISELIFNGLALILSAFSIIPAMLLPALAGGLCSLFLFILFLIPIIYFSTDKTTTLLLTCVLVVSSCFLPLYAFNYFQTGRLILWDTHSRLYQAVLIAAVCSIISILFHYRILFRIQQEYAYNKTHNR